MNANQGNWDMGQEHQQTNPLLILHRHLRGRYVLVIVLGLLFGVSGGVAGYLSRSPEYQSTGIVRIQPSMPKVLFESEQSDAPRMFTSFVNSQAQLISNFDVIRSAVESDDWRGVVNRTGVVLSVDTISDRLVVRPDRSAQEIIRVSYSHTDPLVSEGIVNAVLDAYIEKHGKEGSIKKPEIVRALTSRKLDLENEKAKIGRDIQSILSPYQTDDLEPLKQKTLTQVRDLEERRAEIEVLIEQYKQFGLQRDEMGNLRIETEEDAAGVDPMISDLLSQRTTLENNRTEMMASEGLREDHRDVRRITLMIQNIQQRIDQRLNELRSGESVPLVDEFGRALPSQGALEYQIALIDERLAVAEKAAADLFSAALRLDSLRQDLTNKESSLALVENRLDTINTEALVEEMDQVTGKISVLSRPIRASSPTSDPRIKMAGAGFIGAGSLPVIAVLMLSYFSHRVKYSDDEVLGGANAGIVGMLPDLGSSLEDQELASASAFAVHQIRSQLQIKNTSNLPRIYGVTSPAPGDGKTSLIIAIGLSFAESGSRTLLVDLDFIGRGLSVHFGYPNAPSLADSLTDREQISELIHETEFPGLSILPAGFGDDMRVSRLSPSTVGALLETLRERYDTVLIDTGPILGSVESAFVSPQADGMMLVVGRGQYKPLIKKAIDQIKAVDGTIAATIFNRATVHEVRHASSSMSVHFSRQFSRQQQEQEERNGSRVGPVGGSLFLDRAKNGHSSQMRKVEP